MKIDISDLVKNLAADEAAIMRDVEDEVAFLADAVLEVAREATPERTGTLKRGWQKRSEAGNTLVENNVSYASYVNDGTSKMAGRHMVETAIDAAMARRRA